MWILQWVYFCDEKRNNLEVISDPLMLEHWVNAK